VTGLARRRLVLFLALSLLPELRAQPRPFSHQAHLRLQLTCVSCHPAAAGSARAEDNLLPPARACHGCHAEAAVKKPRRTLVHRFSHRQHVALGSVAPLLRAAVASGRYLSPPGALLEQLEAAGNNACAACHRGLERSTQVSAENFPRMADCLVCHDKIDPPFSCETCHDRSTPLKPASHTPLYLDEHSRRDAGLDKASCAVCHGRHFTCLGCH